MTNNNLESLSALLDDEVNQSEIEQTMDVIGDEQTATFGRYGLIGDVLRNEQQLVTDNAFSMSIQAAIEGLEQDAGLESSVASDSVVAINTHPKWHQRITGKVKSFTSSSTGKGMGQMAIAASVALVAVFGVSNMAPQNNLMPSPVLNTTPLIDGISPVSTDGLKAKPSANQVTQTRINALMADHNQQLRVAEDEELDKDKEENDN